MLSRLREGLLAKRLASCGLHTETNGKGGRLQSAGNSRFAAYARVYKVMRASS